MDANKFNEIVARAIDGLPEEFRNALDNIDIVIEDRPTPGQVDHFKSRSPSSKGGGHMLLLGLYQGIPLNKRQPFFYTGVLPDKITLFKASIDEYCGHDDKLMEEQIRRTLLHEIGHYFGLPDKRLRELGY